MKTWKKFLSLFIVMALAGAIVTGCGSDAEKITFGAQTYTEMKVIGEMYKSLIEDRTDLEVDIVKDLAASPIVINALDKDEVQMATLFSGEIFNNYFDIDETHDREDVLQQAKDGFDEHFGFKWFDPYGYENTYAFTVRKELAEEHQLEKISDIVDLAKDLKLGVDTTWLEREQDGYPAFIQHYDFEFGEEFPMEVNLVYEAVASKDVDIVLAYTTDPRLKEFDLVTLEDDKDFFPPYDASPVVKKETLEAHPELNEVVSLLIGKIDEETIIGLSYEVDVNKRDEAEVAQQFLKEIGLLE